MNLSLLPLAQFLGKVEDGRIFYGVAAAFAVYLIYIFIRRPRKSGPEREL